MSRTQDKDYLMNILSVRMNIPLKIIEAVVEHQFTEARKALLNSYSLELSGFGKFYFNLKKAHKHLEKNISKREMFSKKLENPNLTEKQKESYQRKLDNTIKSINQITLKLNGNKSDIGGMEKQTDTSFGNETVDS